MSSALATVTSTLVYRTVKQNVGVLRMGPGQS